MKPLLVIFPEKIYQMLFLQNQSVPLNVNKQLVAHIIRGPHSTEAPVGSNQAQPPSLMHCTMVILVQCVDLGVSIGQATGLFLVTLLEVTCLML
jgi:hypothetical protein